MEVIRTKIKLLDKKNGTVEVFLSGMTQSYGKAIEFELNKYLDPESNFEFVRENYIATINDPKKTQ